MNRIFFADNPWPNGHAIKELVWSARLDPDNGVWFDLHLKSADYYAEDDDSAGEVDEAESDWKSKTVWNNYHQCILSSTYWGHKGFLAATAEHPLDFAKVSDRKFHLDPLPPPDENDRAFGIYLLGHDGVADHDIRFMPKTPDNKYGLDWSGRIALEYIGSAVFDRTFHAQYDALRFSGVQLPEGMGEDDGISLLNPLILNIGELRGNEGMTHCGWLLLEVDPQHDRPFVRMDHQGIGTPTA